jgi:TPR repeat protein
MNVGETFLAGRAVEKDSVEGLKWLEKGYERMGREGPGMLWRLGDMLMTGNDYSNIPKDPAEGRKCLAKAAELGGADWMWKLGEAYAWKLKHRMYSSSLVAGLRRNPDEAAKWFRTAAEAGDAAMRFELGVMFENGVLRRDGEEAVKWYRKAAEQGHVEAQCNLGVRYANGDGVSKDEVEALAWFNLAAASGQAASQRNRAILENRLGPHIAVLAQQRSKELLKVIEERQSRAAESSGTVGAEGGAREEHKGTGSGVFVTADGVILSAAHVVQGCSKVCVLTSQGVKKAKVLQIDEANDVALLKCEGTFVAAPIVSSGGIRLGQSVFTVGFPNVGIQGFEPKLTKGEVSSMGGFQDDPRQWQISAPVQPGNSGGGLFDEHGNVIGVVVAKLNPLKTARISGDIPQNVNYAVKSAYVIPLLEPMKGRLPPPRKAGSSVRFEDAVQKARESVVLVVAY